MVATNKARMGTSPDERLLRAVLTDIVVLTDNSAGTATNVIADVAAGGEMEDSMASLAGKINELVARVNALTTGTN